MKQVPVILALAASLVAACGGEGDDGKSLPTLQSSNLAPGLYVGKDLATFDFAQVVASASFIVLEGNQVWYANGFVEPLEAAVGTLQFSRLGPASGSPSIEARVFSGSLVSKVSAAGSTALRSVDVEEFGSPTALRAFPQAGQNLRAVGVRVDASRYDYGRGATVSEIVGSWRRASPYATVASPSDPALVISSSGTISGTDSTGCQVSGALAPRVSGKNVFDVTLVLSTGCQSAGQYVGVAVRYLDVVDSRSPPTTRPILLIEAVRADNLAIYHRKLQ